MRLIPWAENVTIKIENLKHENTAFLEAAVSQIKVYRLKYLQKSYIDPYTLKIGSALR